MAVTRKTRASSLVGSVASVVAIGMVVGVALRADQTPTAAPQEPQAAAPAAATPASASPTRVMLDKYCVRCHNAKKQ